MYVCVCALQYQQGQAPRKVLDALANEKGERLAGHSLPVACPRPSPTPGASRPDRGPGRRWSGVLCRCPPVSMLWTVTPPLGSHRPQPLWTVPFFPPSPWGAWEAHARSSEEGAMPRIPRRERLSQTPLSPSRTHCTPLQYQRGRRICGHEERM